MAQTKTLPRVRIPLLSGALGDVPALWVLVALEMGTMVGLRHYFRRHHGG